MISQLRQFNNFEAKIINIYTSRILKEDEGILHIYIYIYIIFNTDMAV